MDLELEITSTELFDEAEARANIENIGYHLARAIRAGIARDTLEADEAGFVHVVDGNEDERKI